MGGPRRPAARDVRASCASARTSSSASAVASARPSGPPSTCPGVGRGHGFPEMPVDGILVGTAAMATLEATTSPAVKQMLVATDGTDHWISAGKAKGGMASGRSQLGADIHEIDNTASRCGQLLDEVAGDAEAVAARRDEIIEALAGTAKPYFGDVGDMTYAQWLQRFVELAIGTSTADARRAALAGRSPGATASPRCSSARRRACTRRTPARSRRCSDDEGDGCSTTPYRRSPRSRRAIPAPRRSSCTRPTCRSSSPCARRWASRSTSCR